MASYTLDDIRAAADAKYGSTDIDLGEGRVLVLHNPLRLTKPERDRLREIQARLDRKDENGEDVEISEDEQVEVMRDTIRVASQYSALTDDLLALVGDDLAVLASIIEAYNKGTQAGEA